MLRVIISLGVVTLNVVNAYFETCDHSIKRLKQGPAIWSDVIAANQAYEDPDFNGMSSLYRFGMADFAKWRDYELNHWLGDQYFQRIGEVYPDATMFGSANPSWQDIMQGMAGTCYIEASLASIAEFPTLVSNVFVTSEKNNVGIYAFRFFIRGKPWIVTVDDYFLFYTSSGSRTPYFARIGQNEQFWAMMLEKAWAKVKGDYTMADGGFVENGLRSLVGCPVYSYTTTDQDADTVHALVMNADSLNYIMGAGTAGSTDTATNECGIAMSHAYSLIAAFELKTSSTVDHKMYMIRNPWGVSYYTGSWNEADSAWTSDYISQVPHSINPTTSMTSDGIFFMDAANFLVCFSDFQIAHYRDGEGYTDTWYDMEGDYGFQSQYEITVPAVDGDLYFTVETYFYGLVPQTCWENGQAPMLTQYIYRDSVSTNNLAYSRVNDYDIYHQPMQFLSTNYTAGEKFVITVKYDWQYGLKSYPARDYTVKVYSKQDLSVLDSQGRTNMWHMDGQFPSGFTDSHYRKETTTWTPDWTPRSLYEIWLTSNNMQQFAELVFNNMWTIAVWFSFY